ncbi:hypothetical protein [Streptomyces sp. NPDC003090]|uniref:hypothetical protein n=1 Tax=Streptomyces sp. NPDC003090 TaxID=3154274 RepID=UPI0037F7692E
MSAAGCARPRSLSRALAVCAAVLSLSALLTACGEEGEDTLPEAADQGAVGELLRGALPCTEVSYRTPRQLARLQQRVAGVDGAGECETEEGEYGTDFFHASDMRQFLQSWSSMDRQDQGERPMMIGRNFGVQTDAMFEKRLLEAGLLYLTCEPGFEPPEGSRAVRLDEGCVATDRAPRGTS